MTKWGERGGTYQSIPDAIYEYLGQHRDLDIEFMLLHHRGFRGLVARYLRSAFNDWCKENVKAKMKADKEAFYGTVVDD
jgi:hypothetical protein